MDMGVSEKKLECNGNQVFEEYVRSNMEDRIRNKLRRTGVLRELGKTLHVRMVLVCGD